MHSCSILISSFLLLGSCVMEKAGWVKEFGLLAGFTGLSACQHAEATGSARPATGCTARVDQGSEGNQSKTGLEF